MPPTHNPGSAEPRPREKLTNWHVLVISVVFLVLGGFSGLSGMRYSELSSEPGAWIQVEDQLLGTRHSCFGYRSRTCGIWLYFNSHEQKVFYGDGRPNYARLRDHVLQDKAVQVWYACPWMGLCVPGEMVVEGLGTIVSFEQTDQELEKSVFYHYLFAAVTIIPGLVFFLIVLWRLRHPPDSGPRRGLSATV